MYFRADNCILSLSVSERYLGEYLWLCILSSRYRGCIFCILSKILFQCIFPNPGAAPATFKTCGSVN